MDGKSRIVRSVFLPAGERLDIAHLGAKTVNGKGNQKIDQTDLSTICVKKLSSGSERSFSCCLTRPQTRSTRTIEYRFG